MSTETKGTLIRALTDLSVRRVGALVVIPGLDPLDRHLKGGVALDGSLSYPLILSLFDPSSVGHDGAMIVADDRVTRFAVQLPLSENFAELGERGTRHSAALGLAERTDALCLVISEETGSISIARAGTLTVCENPGELSAILERPGRRLPSLHPNPWYRLLTMHWSERLLAVTFAIGLWIVFVSGTQATTKTYTVPVMVDNIQADYAVERIEPEQLQVTFSGLRRDFYLVSAADLGVRLDASPAVRGHSRLRISPDDVVHPQALTVQTMIPKKVDLFVRRAEETSAGNGE